MKNNSSQVLTGVCRTQLRKENGEHKFNTTPHAQVMEITQPSAAKRRCGGQLFDEVAETEKRRLGNEKSRK